MLVTARAIVTIDAAGAQGLRRCSARRGTVPLATRGISERHAFEGFLSAVTEIALHPLADSRRAIGC